MEGASNGGILYHEVQESKLCAMHCVNTVLQGPFFSESDLAVLASDLDRKERQMMLEGGVCSGDFLAEESHNVSLDGDFSIQVLQKALEVWDLQVIPLDSPVAEPAQIDPELENAFICHLQDHWFCIRKVNGEWYNFDSLYAAPQHLSKFYLSAYLDSLKGFGWSIFLVRGNFPKEFPISSSEASNGFGQWLSPEDAERITKSCNSIQAPPHQRVNETQQHPDQFLSNGEAEMLSDLEDEDLNAAIAASLMYSSPPMACAEASISPNDNQLGKQSVTTKSSTPPNNQCSKQVKDTETEDLKAVIAVSLMDSSPVVACAEASNPQNDNQISKQRVTTETSPPPNDQCSEQVKDTEAEDLKAAIAASLMDFSPPVASAEASKPQNDNQISRQMVTNELSTPPNDQCSNQVKASEASSNVNDQNNLKVASPASSTLPNDQCSSQVKATEATSHVHDQNDLKVASPASGAPQNENQNGRVKT